MVGRAGVVPGYDVCGSLIARIDQELSRTSGRGVKRGREDDAGESIDALWSELCEVMARFSTALFPAAGALGRSLTNAVTSSVIGLDGTPAAGIGAWEAAVTCAHIFPSIGAMVLTEVFELVLQSGSLWDTPFLVSAGYKGTIGAAHGGSDMQRAVTHRLSSLASLIEVSVGYVDPKLACRFASQFCFNTTPAGITAYHYRFGSTPCHPHCIVEVVTALLTSLRPCPASVLLEGSARCSGLLPAAGLGKRAPAHIPTAASHRAHHAALSRLRSIVDLLQHPRVLPFYRPPNLVMDESVRVEGRAHDDAHVTAPLLPRAPAPVHAAPPQAPSAPKVAVPFPQVPKATLPTTETTAPAAVAGKKVPLTMADIPELDM